MPKTTDIYADRLAVWHGRAVDHVARRLRDARAHAEAGRLEDANHRLGELEGVLVYDVLGKAREEFYRDAHVFHDLDDSIRDPDVVPTREGAAIARSTPILGRDQARDVKRSIDEAMHGLRLAAVASFGDAAVKPAIHQTWEQRHRSAIGSAMRGLLSDAQIALREAVSQLMIRADVR